MPLHALLNRDVVIANSSESDVFYKRSYHDHGLAQAQLHTTLRRAGSQSGQERNADPCHFPNHEVVHDDGTNYYNTFLHCTLWEYLGTRGKVGCHMSWAP